MAEHSKSRRSGAPDLGAALTEGGLFLLAVLLPALLGAAHSSTALIGCLVACATVVALCRYRRTIYLEVPWFALVLFALTGVTLLQLLPLPVGLLQLVAPATVEVLSTSLGDVGGLAAWHPISLDPPATAWEAMKIATCSVAFVIAHNHLHRESRRKRLLLWLLVGACITVMIGFFGALETRGGVVPPVAAGALPERSGGLITASFYNPNHAAAYLSLCAILGAGLVVTTRRSQLRTLVTVGVIWVGVGVFLTLSRGGILALGLGLGLLALLIALFRIRGGWRPAVLVPAAAGLTIAMAAFLVYERVVLEFFPHLDGRIDLSKIAIWPSGIDMALSNPWVGVGRGAFATAFPRYLDNQVLDGGEATFAYLENQFIHLPTEWGLIVGTGAIVLTMIAFASWLRRAARDVTAAAIGAALLALAGHNLVDYNLELIGIALPAAVLAGALSASASGGSARGTGEEPRPVGRRGRVRAALLALVVLTAAASGLYGLFRAPTGSSHELKPAVQAAKQGAAFAKLQTLVAPVIRRHPADYYPHLLLGRFARDRRRPESLRALNRAMFLYPKSPLLHRETGDVLRLFGRRRQALIEYQLALVNGAGAALVRHALPLCHDLDDVVLMLPLRAALFGSTVSTLLKAGRKELALALADHALSRWPDEAQISDALLRTLLANGKHRRALSLATSRAEREPSEDIFLLWSRAALMSGSVAEQRRILERGLERLGSSERLKYALAYASSSAKQFARAHQLAKGLLDSANSVAGRAKAFDLLARIHQEEGRPHEANWARAQARRLRALPR